MQCDAGRPRGHSQAAAQVQWTQLKQMRVYPNTVFAVDLVSSFCSCRRELRPSRYYTQQLSAALGHREQPHQFGETTAERARHQRTISEQNATEVVPSHSGRTAQCESGQAFAGAQRRRATEG